MLALCIESSHARGMGHLFRSLILADALTQRGHDVVFLLNNDPTATQILRQRGQIVESVDLSDDISGWETLLIKRYGLDLWIDDRLNTSASHARHIKAAGISLVTFDDRGQGALLADLHIAGLTFDDGPSLHGHRVLHGPDFLMLNPEIGRHRRARQSLGRVLVTLGGSDTWGVTVRVVALLAERGRSATVIIGPSFRHQQALSTVLTPDFVVKQGVASMIEEMSHHDLAITGGGMTPFEANASGLPCLVIANEVFEIPVGQALERLGGSLFAGHHASLDVSVFDRILPIDAMSRAAMRSIGLEGTRRVIEAIEALLLA